MRKDKGKMLMEGYHKICIGIFLIKGSHDIFQSTVQSETGGTEKNHEDPLQMMTRNLI